MRAIRFRGKALDKSLGWIFGDLIQMSEFFPIIQRFESTVLVKGEECHKFTQDKVHPETVGQYTGLYDRNKKEIYEGDLLKFWDDDTGLIEVRFVRGVFAFLWQGDLDDELPINAPTQEWATVVGNIHDNPELMEGGEK